MSMLFILFCGLFGLIVGSFLNVVIARLHTRETVVRGRSRCPHCHHELAARDLVPLVSFVVLRGKCRFCCKPISWQYPLVEFVTGSAFALIAFRLGLPSSIGDSILFTAYLLYVCFLVVIFVYDLKHYLILDRVILPLAILAFAISLLHGVPAILSSLLGSVIAGGFFLALILLSRGRWMGGGDAKFGFALGLMLGFPAVIVALFAAFLLGSIVAMGLMAAGKKKMGDKVPFGTFLALGAFIALLWGEQVVAWYLALLGF